MRRLLSTIFLVFTIYGFTSAQQWVLPIAVTDGNPTVNFEIRFGIHPDATDGFDQGFDDLAPPKPPSGNFDVRFVSPVPGGDDKLFDIRDNQINRKEFIVTYEASSGYGPVVLSWDTTQARMLTDSLYILDNITGTLFGPYDMRTQNSIASNLNAFVASGIRIILVPAEATAIEEETTRILPTKFEMSIYPNPFNPETTISYNIPVAGPVKINVYNLLGQNIKELVNGNESAGQHQIRWNGTNNSGNSVQSGFYFVMMQSSVKADIKKVVLLK